MTPGKGNRILPPTCACEKGFSDGGPEEGCIVCNSPCFKCRSFSPTDCISCVDQYYIKGKICEPCTPGCKTCPNDPNNCTTCIDGYFMVQSGTPCHKCPSPCATCLNANYCLSTHFSSIFALIFLYFISLWIRGCEKNKVAILYMRAWIE